MATVPAASVADWSATGGYSLGIPDTSGFTVVTSASIGLVGDSTNGTDGTDNTSTFQSWITNTAANNTVVQMGTGGYRFTGQVGITGKRIVVRGNGASGLTKNTKVYHNSAIQNNLFYNYRGSTSNTAIAISSGYTQGSTSLVFASSGAISTIAVGDWIWVSQLNDASIPVNIVGSGSSATYCGVPGTSGTRVLVQQVQVTAKNSATLTINRGLYYTLTSGNTPQILENALQDGSGFEGLYMERTGGAAGADEDCNIIKFDWVYNGWVKDCEITKMAAGGVCMVNTYGIVVQGNYIHDPRDTTSGNGYAVWPLKLNSDAFIFNNYALNCRHNYIPEGSTCGFVFLANYGDGATSSDDPNFMFGATDTHAAFPYVNLFEGISDTKQAHDNTIGNACFNTHMRSWYRGQGTSVTFTNGLAASVIEQNSHWNNLVACIIGKSGQTGNKFATNGQATNSRSSYRWGFVDTGSTSLADSAVATTTVLNGTYDFISNSKTDLNASGLDAPDTVKSLLYGSTRPSWATKWWPLFDPNYPSNADNNNIPIYYSVNNSGAAYPDYTPTSLAATGTSSSTIGLTWVDHATGETGYLIERSADGVSGWTQVGTAAANATSYSDTGLAPNTTYYYRVAAYLGSNVTTTPYSNVDDGTTSPAAGGGITITNFNITTFVVH